MSRRVTAASGIVEAERMALATATPDGRPSVRMVLVKGADERGLFFFTNYASRKGGELAANPRAALLFHYSLAYLALLFVAMALDPVLL
jgi:pyridoxamine 5'-phosphate oxidase